MNHVKRITGMFGIVVVLVVFIWMIQLATNNKPYADQLTRFLAEGLADSPAYNFFYTITHFGSDIFLVPFVIIMAIILFIWFKDWLVPVLFAGGTLLSHGLNLLIKYIFARERPGISLAANAEGHSFPSGHAMISMVCYGLLAYFICQKIKSKTWQNVILIISAVVILLIGASRFVINVHYLTDIVAGFVIGYGLLIGFVSIYRKTRLTEKKIRSHSKA